MSLADRELRLFETFKVTRCKIVETHTDNFIRSDDVRDVVSRVLKRIRELPNRDDTLDFKGARMCILDGGGVGKFEVLKIIEEETGFSEKDQG